MHIILCISTDRSKRDWRGLSNGRFIFHKFSFQTKVEEGACFSKTPESFISIPQRSCHMLRPSDTYRGTVKFLNAVKKIPFDSTKKQDIPNLPVLCEQIHTHLLHHR